uniref:Uncharacterized protein n=1 Tax=Micrurus lemniscatus lemniscatus TaxID=129467 RepID=A0A2D4J753_MICLE
MCNVNPMHMLHSLSTTSVAQFSIGSWGWGLLIYMKTFGGNVRTLEWDANIILMILGSIPPFSSFLLFKFAKYDDSLSESKKREKTKVQISRKLQLLCNV